MKDDLVQEVDRNPLYEPVLYQIQNKTFIVEPVFKTDGQETLGSILIRLMKSDIEAS